MQTLSTSQTYRALITQPEGCGYHKQNTKKSNRLLSLLLLKNRILLLSLKQYHRFHVNSLGEHVNNLYLSYRIHFMVEFV